VTGHQPGPVVRCGVVHLDGRPGLLASGSSARKVAVRFAVTAKAGDTTPTAKKRITVTGTVKPARAATTVVLQRLSGKTRVKIVATTTKANGSHAFSASFAKGTTKIRVLVPTTAFNAEQASGTSTIRAS
jgi:hypothetical protein